MNKQDLVLAVAKEAGLSKKDAEKAVTATFASIVKAVKKGDKVSLVGFGSFEARKRAARVGRNPQTKAEIKIPATKIPAFKAGKGFKDAVAK